MKPQPPQHPGSARMHCPGPSHAPKPPPPAAPDPVAGPAAPVPVGPSAPKPPSPLLVAPVPPDPEASVPEGLTVEPQPAIGASAARATETAAKRSGVRRMPPEFAKSEPGGNR